MSSTKYELPLCSLPRLVLTGRSLTLSLCAQNQDGVIDQEEFLAIMKQTSIY
jgi:hypothetical protein